VSKVPHLRARARVLTVEHKQFPVLCLFIRVQPRLKRLHLTGQHKLTAAVHVPQDLLFKLRHLFPQNGGCVGQASVVRLQTLDFVLQPRDALQFAPSAFRGRKSVAKPFAFRFNALLVLHVDWRHWW